MPNVNYPPREDYPSRENLLMQTSQAYANVGASTQTELGALALLSNRLEATTVVLEKIGSRIGATADRVFGATPLEKVNHDPEPLKGPLTGELENIHQQLDAINKYITLIEDLSARLTRL